MEKYRRADQVTDENTAHARCMLYTLGCRHTLRICRTYCLFTATYVPKTRLDGTLL